MTSTSKNMQLVVALFLIISQMLGVEIVAGVG